MSWPTSHSIVIYYLSSTASGAPLLAEGVGVRISDIVGRVRAGDLIEDVASDFGVEEDSVRLLLAVADALPSPTTEGEER